VTIFGKAVAATALVAMSLTSVPAQAERHRRHNNNDRIDGGDVLLGAVLAGGLFAILSGAGKKKAPEEVEPTPVIGPEEGNRTVSVARTDEEAAVDACVSSAESEGRRYARIAKIDKVTIVDAVASDWIIRGTLGLREDYRDTASEHRDFTCRVGDRGVEQVTIDGPMVAAN
jgi:hypothetical protein